MKANDFLAEYALPENEPFDPEGAGYDMETALAAGIKPDKTGHWASRDPRTGMILKGRSHKTINKSIEADEAAGYEMYKGSDGRYYSRKKGESDFVNPLKVVGSVIAQAVLTPGAGLRAAYELIKTGDLNKAQAVMEQVIQFPADSLNEREKDAARNLGRFLGTPVEKAGEGWQQIIRMVGLEGTIAEPIAGTLGEASAIFGMGGRAKPKAADFLKQYEGSKSLVSDTVGAQIMPPEEIMARLKGYRPGMEEIKPGASSTFDSVIAEAEKLGMKPEGIQEGVGNIPDTMQFTDPRTKSTLLVKPGESVEAALESTREPFIYDIINQKVEHRRVLQNLMNEGSLTKEHIIRGTDVEGFRKIMENDRLVLGNTYEGQQAISAFKLSAGQDFENIPMYGSNMSDHIVMIGKSHMIEGEGMAPGEVFWNADTPPQDITYLYKGEQYNYGDLKTEIGGME